MVRLLRRVVLIFHHVQGEALPVSATASRPELAGHPFEAMGVSLVIHPRNPYVPTVHANWRFFTSTPPMGDKHWWFGGGFDLTPYYGFTEDCIHWHKVAHAACYIFGEDVYPRYKKCCDEYFYIKHRKEPRGIGGLFFDDVNHWDFETCFNFVKSCGDHFIPAYQPIMKRRKAIDYGERERAFQALRRGRYAEFNLVYDRGTLFGLQTGGRTESILISLPPKVHWQYNWIPPEDSEEAKLIAYYLQARDWLAIEK